VSHSLGNRFVDAFGAPDAALPTFTTVQKAINYSMTSFFTTGGIRGGRKSMDKFHPRSFNLGVSRKAFDAIGGYGKMRFGEDIDFSIRLYKNNCIVKLFPSAFVFHKRRTDWRKFFKQVFNSGIARINLYKLYPDSLKLVHLLPAAFVVFALGSIAGLFFCWYTILPIPLLALLLFADASIRNRSGYIGLLAVVASFVQLTGYGTGFLTAAWYRLLLRKDRFSAFEKNFYK
jgi:GT2 family glycosyltransferase